jgi:uncharacterized protein YcbX
MMSEELNASEITSHGVLGDRVFACIDNENGNVVSAKNPKKVLVPFASKALPSIGIYAKVLAPAVIRGNADIIIE